MKKRWIIEWDETIKIYEFTLLTDFNKSWLVLSRPLIIPKLLPTPPTPPMPKPNFRSFCTTEWCRWPPVFWFTMCECECEWPWSCWCNCLLLCWADFSFLIFSCSSRSRRAYSETRIDREKENGKMVSVKIWYWNVRYYIWRKVRQSNARNAMLTCSLISLTARNSFFNFMRRFWNQIFICRSVKHNAWAISIRRLRVK